MARPTPIRAAAGKPEQSRSSLKINRQTKRSIVLTVLLALNLGFALVQAKNPRKECTAVDSHTYKKGDILTFGTPARGTEYEYIIISDIVSIGDYITVFTRGTIEEKKSNNATKKQLSKMNGSVIKHFANGIQDNKLAVLKYNDSKEVLVFLDRALQNGEIKSQTQNFQTTADKTFANKASSGQRDGGGTVESFSPDFDVKILSVVGDKEAQAVTVNLLISHKVVHQGVCFNKTCSLFDIKKSKYFDYEGDGCPCKEARIGNERTTYSVCNTIPTRVSLETFVIFKQILPSVQDMSFITILVTYGAGNGENYTCNDLELSNLVIDWR